MDEKIYNPENNITDFKKIIIFNHIYQHYIFHISKDKHEFPVSVNVKIQGLPGTGKTFIANTIRNIDINFKSFVFIIYLLCSNRMSCFINQWNHTTSIIQYSYWKELSYDS